jgi:hypothetical protein
VQADSGKKQLIDELNTDNSALGGYGESAPAAATVPPADGIGPWAQGADATAGIPNDIQSNIPPEMEKWFGNMMDDDRSMIVSRLKTEKGYTAERAWPDIYKAVQSAKKSKEAKDKLEAEFAHQSSEGDKNRRNRIDAANIAADSRNTPKVKPSLNAEYNRAVSRVSGNAYENLDEDIRRQLERDVERMALAVAIQDRQGGPQAMPDIQAKTEASNLIQIREVLMDLETAADSEASAGAGTDYAEGFLKRLPADVYEQVRGILAKGVSPKQFLLEINRTIQQYGVN